MREDEEGFLYPEVDGSCCTECGICAGKCQALNPPVKRNLKSEAFVVALKDKQKLAQSTSGGAFAAFAEKILENGGVVFGAAYDENLYPSQTCVENLQDLQKLKGSKYVESDTADSFRKAKEILDGGRKVLYSGTPCQIAGLRVFLGKEYDNLFTVDLICHGVPSRKLFTRWLEWLGKKTGGKIIYVGFRDKDVGGWSCGGKVKTKTNTKTKTKPMNGFTDPYYASFLRCETYRESCYQCPYSSMNRPGDITIGDFWGVENYYPDIDKTKGVSCVIVNTAKGRCFFDLVKEQFYLRSTPLENIQSQNANLNHPSLRPVMRSAIYTEIDTKPLNMFFRQFKESKRGYKVVFYSRQWASKVIPAPLKKLIKYMCGSRIK